VDAGTQQQWISRSSEWGSWYRLELEHGVCGCKPTAAGEWPKPPFTKVAVAPVVREKPFLFVDVRGRYLVRVPAVQTNASGVSWGSGATPGRSIPLSRFFVAKPGDTAAQINAQLAAGKHLLLTPGIYALDEPIRVARAGTIVLGWALPR